MKKFGALFKTYRGPLLAGVLIGTTYIPFPPWALVACYVPLWLWLDEEASSRWQAFKGAWLTQFILTLIGFHWIAYTASAFGQFHWSLAGVTLLLFAALVHLHIPIAALAAFELKTRLKLHGAPALFVFALCLALIERIWPMIFPWHLGYTLLWAKIPIFQWADTVGFWGLSSFVLLLNAWIAWLWQKQDNSSLVFRNVAMVFALIIALMVGGIWKKRGWQEFDDTLNAAVIQANIGDMEKVYAERGRGYQSHILERYLTLSQQSLTDNADAQLLIWPETALPTAPDRRDHSGSYLDRIRLGMAPFGRHILTGAYSREQDPPGGGRPLTYNAVFLLNAQGDPVAAPYRKTHLLAFGEYMPFSETFPVLLEWLPFISNFGRGVGATVQDLPRPSGVHLKIGPQICYEGLFPEFSRQSSLAGAEVLVNVTNDSWFGVPFEPRQHMTMTLARAIETRRPLIRSTNTGISTAILANGDQLGRSPNDREWIGLFRVPYKRQPETTFYVLYGHWDWALLSLALVALLTRGWLHARTRRT